MPSTKRKVKKNSLAAKLRQYFATRTAEEVSYKEANELFGTKRKPLHKGYYYTIKSEFSDKFSPPPVETVVHKTKSQYLREFFVQHPDASLDDAISNLLSQGVKASRTLASEIRTKMQKQMSQNVGSSKPGSKPEKAENPKTEKPETETPPAVLLHVRLCNEADPSLPSGMSSVFDLPNYGKLMVCVDKRTVTIKVRTE